MKTAQLYRTQMRDGYVNDYGVKHAHFIYPDPDSSIIIGFVSEIEGDVIEICLFEQVNVPDDCDVFAESLGTSDVLDILMDSLTKNPAMGTEWIRVLGSDNGRSLPK